MRPQDFLSGKLEDVKFRVSVPGELITTQESVDEFAIGFADWLNTLIDRFGLLEYKRNYMNKTKKELLEIYKKEKGL